MNVDWVTLRLDCRVALIDSQKETAFFNWATLKCSPFPNHPTSSNFAVWKSIAEMSWAKRQTHSSSYRTDKDNIAELSRILSYVPHRIQSSWFLLAFFPMNLLQPECQTRMSDCYLCFVASIFEPPDWLPFQTAPVAVARDIFCFIIRGLDKINQIIIIFFVCICTYIHNPVIIFADAVVATYIFRYSWRSHTASNRQTAYLSSTPCSCDRGVLTASKRCYYIKYLPMARLLANCSRSFLFLSTSTIRPLWPHKRPIGVQLPTN